MADAAGILPATASLKANGAPLNFLRKREDGISPPRSRQNRGAVQLPEGVTVDSDAPKQIAFDGRGVIAPMPREAPSIRINGADGYYLFVVVSPTGQVTVSEPQKDRT